MATRSRRPRQAPEEELEVQGAGGLPEPEPEPAVPAAPAAAAFDPVRFLGLPAGSVPAEDCLKAIELARRAASATCGRGLPRDPSTLPHPAAQAIRLLATALLMQGLPEEVPSDRKIPAVVRYYLSLPF